jgi:tetratricopeptide (TPR) repeat protein
LARGYLRLNDSPLEALADFQAAERIDANNPSALQNLASLYSEHLANSSKSIEYLDRLISLRPRQAGPLASRGILKARLKDFQAAIADAEGATALLPGAREKLQIAGIYAMASEQESGEQPLEDDQKGKLRLLAVKWLARALKADPALAGLAKFDPDLDAIKEEPEFRRLADWSQLLDRAAR